MKRFAVSAHNFNFPTIQAGKRYEVSDWEQTGLLQHEHATFNIETTDFEGCPFTANCLAFVPCAFLEGERWTIIEERENITDG